MLLQTIVTTFSYRVIRFRRQNFVYYTIGQLRVSGRVHIQVSGDIVASFTRSPWRFAVEIARRGLGRDDGAYTDRGNVYANISRLK